MIELGGLYFGGVVKAHRAQWHAESRTPILPAYLCVLCYAYSHSCVRLFVTPWAVAHQAPLSMGILQARILEWVARPSSKGSSQPRDRT